MESRTVARLPFARLPFARWTLARGHLLVGQMLVGHLPSPIQKRTFARRRVARLYHLLAIYLCIVSQIQQTFI